MDQPRRLGPAEIEARLVGLKGWERAGGVIRRELRFRDFAAAFAFMTRVAMLAEKANHHPNWSNAWNRVVIELTTHDAGGLTEKDFDLAQEIDRIA